LRGQKQRLEFGAHRFLVARLDCVEDWGVVRHKLVLLGTLLITALAVSAVPASAQGSGRHVFAGTKPSWTAGVRQSAPLAAGERVSAQVWLTPRNAAQLDALAQAVSDPRNSLFRKFLSSGQYDALFAPSASAVAAVTQWLTGSGLHVDGVAAGNAYLSVSGPAFAMNIAFGTQLQHYIVNGKPERAPAQDISVPASVADSVLAVTGLTTFGHTVKPADFGPPGGFRNNTPCSSFYAQQVASSLPKFKGRTLPYATCGYVPSQLRNAYGVGQGGGFGQGQTVAITDAFDSPRLASDANQYSTNRGDSPFKGSQFQDRSVPECQSGTGLDCATLQAQCGGNGWYGEQNLDIEAVHGMAPRANVLYYGAGSCFDVDLLAQLNQVVQDNKASIVTNSWGQPTFVVGTQFGCPAGQVCIVVDQPTINAYESIFKHGAMLGIGFYFSSGDNGDELQAFGFSHPDFPTGDPWVTSVGGTSLAIGRNGQRIFETGWGTSQWRSTNGYHSWNLNIAPFQYGSGGGYSQIFAQPTYQNGVVMNNPTGGRAVPDIGAVGDPTTGMLIGITQNFADTGVGYGEFRIGGTSLSSPLMAGIQADAQSISGHRIGFANPEIYFLARVANGVYYDVTPQGDDGNIRSDFVNGLNSASGIRFSVRTFDQDSSLVTGPGWDDVTGVGAVTASYIQLMEQGRQH
jgi:subtilase family serine protease